MSNLLISANWLFFARSGARRRPTYPTLRFGWVKGWALKKALCRAAFLRFCPTYPTFFFEIGCINRYAICTWLYGVAMRIRHSSGLYSPGDNNREKVGQVGRLGNASNLQISTSLQLTANSGLAPI